MREGENHAAVARDLQQGRWKAPEAFRAGVGVAKMASFMGTTEQLGASIHYGIFFCFIFSYWALLYNWPLYPIYLSGWELEDGVFVWESWSFWPSLGGQQRQN